MKKIYTTLRQVVKATAFFGMVATTLPVQAQEVTYNTEGWYGTAALSKIIDTESSGMQANLGSGVIRPGEIDYNGNFAGALAVGHENSFCRKNNTPIYLRTEGEYLMGSADRKSATVDQYHTVLDDSVDFRALFANALLGIEDTQHTRWWLGGGIGYGWIDRPAITGCSSTCSFAAATTDGFAWQLKAVVERTISKNAALFAEARYVALPGESNGTSQCYDDINVATLGIGFRSYF